MNPPPFLIPQADGVLLRTHVQPRASRSEIGGLEMEALRIRVTAPPVAGAANEAVVKLLARTLGIAKSRVQLVRGGTSRHKVFKLHGIEVAVAAAKLEPHRGRQ